MTTTTVNAPNVRTSTSTSTNFVTGRAARVAGWIVTTLVTLFLGFDAVTHLLRAPQVMAANATFGAPEAFPLVCGGILAACVIAYLVPASRALGTILITAYLGGAVAANLITEHPLANSGFAIITAVLVWAGAWPRDARLRALVRR